MSLRLAIVIMSACGVISDAILIAFYPQFFAMRYGVTSTVHVGAYIAAISIAVMVTLPLWARVARHVETMHLVFVTQGLAGLLGMASVMAETVTAFWAVTMLMFMTKSSYLLMFPYLMRVERAETHSATVGLLAVVVHLAGIFGAMAGGLLLQRFGADACLLAMAAGDFAQMALCLHVIRAGKVVVVLGATASSPSHRHGTLPRVFRLAVLMLLFDFSAYLVRPFFSVYWETTTGIADRTLTGLVFAIPGLMALLALWLDRQKRTGLSGISSNLILGGIGLALQAAPWAPAILMGRCLYGWALFRVSVKLEVMLFRISTPQAYARDFSIANGFQNLGVLLSSFCAGYVVEQLGMTPPFLLAAIGLLLTAVAGHLILPTRRRLSPAPSCQTEHAN